jgi:DNA-binding GntR family transcriptional regulator
MPERHTSPALRKLAASFAFGPSLEGVEAEIYDRLWRAMVECKLRPGTKLREDVIGDTFGVSRTTVRKVLQIMEQEGITYLPANRGAYIASPSPDETRAVLEVYLMLVRHIAHELAARKSPISADHRSLLEQHLVAQAEAEATHDYVTARILSSEFIIVLAAIHGNFLLTKQAAELSGRIALSLAMYQAEHVYLNRAPIHRDILASIAAHKADEAIASFEAAFHATEKTLRFDAEGLEVDLAAILLASAETAPPPQKTVRKRAKKA